MLMLIFFIYMAVGEQPVLRWVESAEINENLYS